MSQHKPEQVVHSYVFSSLPLTAVQQHQDGWQTVGTLGSTGEAEENTAEAGLVHALNEARQQLISLLQVTGSAASEVNTALARYLGLLAADNTGPALPPTLQRPLWTGAILGLQPQHDSSCSTASSSSCSNAATLYTYEAAHVLLAVATWKLGKAASLVCAAAGTDAVAAMEAYQLCCQAAGLLDELRRGLLPQLELQGSNCSCSCCSSSTVSGGGDLNKDVLTGLHHFALAEAQVLMLQRGMAQAYQGSTLAPLATDTAILYSQAYEAFEAAAVANKLPWAPATAATAAAAAATAAAATAAAAAAAATAAAATAAAATAGDNSSSSHAKDSRMASFEAMLSMQLPEEWPAEALPLLQLTAYVQFQLCSTYCLAAVCGAEACLSSNRAGQAVAAARLGVNLCGQLQDLGAQHASLIDPHDALGVVDSSRRLGVQDLLSAKAAHVLKKSTRENRTIYFMYVPEVPPALPCPQRSAKPEHYQLPKPLRGGQASVQHMHSSSSTISSRLQQQPLQVECGQHRSPAPQKHKQQQAAVGDEAAAGSPAPSYTLPAAAGVERDASFTDDSCSNSSTLGSTSAGAAASSCDCASSSGVESCSEVGSGANCSDASELSAQHGKAGWLRGLLGCCVAPSCDEDALSEDAACT